MNRLAVVAVQEEENQLLCVTKTEDSTGKVEADAEKEAINNWGLSEGIIACCFDTTSSNSGINSGSCVLLQHSTAPQQTVALVSLSSSYP